MKKLIKDVTDCYIRIANHDYYFVTQSDRKDFSLATQEVKLKDICLKIDELVDAVNALSEAKNGKI